MWYISPNHGSTNLSEVIGISSHDESAKPCPPDTWLMNDLSSKTDNYFIKSILYYVDSHSHLIHEYPNRIPMEGITVFDHF